MTTPAAKQQAAHAALQRIVVRMQHDGAFRARLLDELARGVPDELGRLGLGERERGWLRAVDGRAWSHDPLRRRRLLHGLMGELKASSAIALAETRRIAFLDGFFASASFHDAVQHDGSLAAAYARYLLEARLTTPQLADVVRIEAQLAASRRAVAAAGGPDWQAPAIPARLDRVALAPGVAVAEVAASALPSLNAVERYLFEVGLVPAIALATDAPPLVLPDHDEASRVRLAFIPTPSGVSLVELDAAMHDALAALQQEGGALPTDAIGEALARELLDDEVLVAA